MSVASDVLLALQIVLAFSNDLNSPSGLHVCDILQNKLQDKFRAKLTVLG